MQESKKFNENILENMIQEYGKLYQTVSNSTDNVSVFIMGSQSIWGNLESPNKKLLSSSDLDLLPNVNIAEEMGVDLKELDNHVAFCAGEGTEKVEKLYNGKFLDVISEQTVCAPTQWKDRVKEKTYSLNNGTNITASFLDKHDLVIAKMIAGREKDLDYVQTLIMDNSVSIRKINKLLNSKEVIEPIRRKLSETFQEVDDKKILEFKKNIANRLNSYVKNSFSNGRNKGQPLKKIEIKNTNIFIDYNNDCEMPNKLISEKHKQKLNNNLNNTKKSRHRLELNIKNK